MKSKKDVIEYLSANPFLTEEQAINIYKKIDSSLSRSLDSKRIRSLGIEKKVFPDVQSDGITA